MEVVRLREGLRLCDLGVESVVLWPWIVSDLLKKEEDDFVLSAIELATHNHETHLFRRRLRNLD